MIRYFSSKAALATIKERKLRVSRVSAFNDPFEFSLERTMSDGRQLPYDWLRKRMDSEVRILCACDPTRLQTGGDILMWSHYAEKHTGFRIHFDKDFLKKYAELFWDVEYEDSVPLFNPDDDTGIDLGARMTQAFEALSLALRAKGKFWAYEQEVRFFFKKKRCRFDKRNDVHFLPCADKAITRVDCGLNTKPRNVALMKSILSATVGKQIPLFRAEKIPGRFAIRYLLVA